MKQNANILVTVDKGFDRALRDFTKKCGKENIISEYKERVYFKSKSELKRAARMRAKKKSKRSDQRKQYAEHKNKTR